MDISLLISVRNSHVDCKLMLRPIIISKNIQNSTSAINRPEYDLIDRKLLKITKNLCTESSQCHSEDPRLSMSSFHENTALVVARTRY